jgi:hypothetical protein
MPYFHSILIVMHFWVEMGHSRDSKFFFFSPRNFQTCCGAHPSFYLVCTGSSSGVKWLESEFDHSHPSSAEVKNKWS